MKETQQYTMKYPMKLLKKIDKIKNELGYTSRNNTITYLLNYAIDDLENKRKDKL
jgi:metal-responsive CopG/Arc/MetJ family transcriptional regulator